MFGNYAVVNPSTGSNNNNDFLTQILMSAWQQYSNSHPKQIPQKMTPQQQAIYDKWWASVNDPAYANNGHLVNAVATDIVKGGPPQWTSPKTSTGETGYSPAAIDWSKALASFGGTPGVGTPPSTPGPITTSSGGLPSATTPGGLDTLPTTQAGGNTTLGGAAPTSIADAVARYGKPVAEILASFMTMNPVLGIKGAWDAYQAWKNGGNDPNKIPDLTTGAAGNRQFDPSMFTPAGQPIRTPVETPGNTMFDPMGLGYQGTFNTNLANGPGQDPGGAQQAGFGYGMPYDDSKPGKIFSNSPNAKATMGGGLV